MSRERNKTNATRAGSQVNTSVEKNPFKKFQSIARILSSVSKSEVDKKESAYQRKLKEIKKRKTGKT